MSASVRQWLGLVGGLAALLLAGLETWSAITVQYCPSGGASCEWSPWLGLPAGVIALLALAACVRLHAWRRDGRGGAGAGVISAATILLALMWTIVTLVVVAAATAD